MKKLIIACAFLLFMLSSVSAIDYFNATAYWTFNQGSGNVLDETGNGHTLTTSFGNFTLGKIGNASILRQGNVESFVAAASADWAFGTDNFTIAFWYNSTGNTSNSEAFGLSQNVNSWKLVHSGTGKIQLVENSFARITSSNVENSSFNRIVIKRESTNATGLKLYVNGNLFNVTNLTSSITDATSVFNLSTANTARNVTIDDLRIYKGYAWSDQEVRNDYNSNLGSEIIPVVLNTPLNASTVSASSIIFNATINNFIGSPTSQNITLYLWNSSNSVINRTTNSIFANLSSNSSAWNITSFLVGTYKWNAFACHTNSTATKCAFAPVNNTFTYGYSFNSNAFSSPVGEFSSQSFVLNVSIPSGLLSSIGNFYYNNSLYGSTRTTEGINTLFTSTITTPSVSSDTNISFVWQLALSDGGGTSYFNVTNGSQQVNSFLIDNCTSNSVLILNFSLRDEDTQSFITPSNATNTTIEVELTLTSSTNSTAMQTFNMSYANTNPAQVCVGSGILNSSTYILSSITRYVTDTRVSEFYHIQNTTVNNNTIPYNINLYDLLTTRSQEFLITFVDENFNPVENALINIQRRYIPEAAFKTVEIPKTDNNGNTLGHFVLSSVVYSITVTKDGKVLAIYDNVVPFCTNQATGDCKIPLSVFGSGVKPEDLFRSRNLYYSFSFNETTRTVNVLFGTIDGSTRSMTLNATKFDALGNTSVCSYSVESSGGTLPCVIPQSFGNITIQAVLYSEGEYIAQAFYTIKQKAADTFGGTRIVMAMMIFGTAALMGITSGIATVVLGLLGMIMVVVLNVIEGGSLIGAGTAIGWFAIAAIVMLYKLGRRMT